MSKLNKLQSQLFSLFYLKKKDEFLMLSNAKNAYLYFKNRRTDLLTGEKEEIGISYFLDILAEIKISDNQSNPVVSHLFYELGELFLFDKVDEELPLAIFIEYQNDELVCREKFFSKTSKLEFEADKVLSGYNQQFETIQKHLHKGDCYQVNLTRRIDISMKENCEFEVLMNSFFKSDEKLSAYAHATNIPSFDKLYLSNSPECLFNMNLESNEIFSMPIKGSYSLSDGREDEQWTRMKQDSKEQAELYMITDMIRNDLAKISNFSAYVRATKMKLIVPGILHQYSIVAAKVSNELNLYDLIKAIFPAASITGAPKRRVMEIIKHTEISRRGFYCGSTLLCIGAQKSASINIRSAELTMGEKIFKYGAGGGVTLQSKFKSEKEELLSKLRSFIELF